MPLLSSLSLFIKLSFLSTRKRCPITDLFIVHKKSPTWIKSNMHDRIISVWLRTNSPNWFWTIVHVSFCGPPYCYRITPREALHKQFQRYNRLQISVSLFNLKGGEISALLNCYPVISFHDAKSCLHWDYHPDFCEECNIPTAVSNLRFSVTDVQIKVRVCRAQYALLRLFYSLTNVILSGIHYRLYASEVV